MSAILKMGLCAVACLFAVAGAASEYPSKPIRLVPPFPQGRRTGSRRGFWCWGGDGAQPPGWMRRCAAGLAAAAAAWAFAISPASLAQTYPTKPIRLVAPFAPGGGTDVLARIVGQKLNERWGQAVVVDNRPGAGGNIGADLVAKSAPDGYTLMLGGVPHAISMTLYKKLPYELSRDMIATAPVATFPSMIVVHPAIAAHNVQELLALGKAKPGALNYGSPGNGSPNHLAIELLCTLGGLKMQHIPYKSAGQVASELLGGQVQLASMGFPTAMPHVKAGKMRALAVTSASRSPMLPDLPTVAESGLPGFDVT
ncbi:MAG TPA: tripartite tricarboxylate transporter substrate-binding protein, partial [Burkholderiales bacterium]|nr:tripartite tricarboxylate transporter substrate-binding protein [Burkholderiales bacterium]